VKVSAWYLAACVACLACAAQAQPRAIDTDKSTMTVRVFKSGMLSALGHDHEISAPIASGTVDANAKQVEFRVRAADMKVRDPNGPEKDRDQVQANMVGPEVLDAQKFAEIVFRSTSVDAGGEGTWKVQGDLKLHGQSSHVTVEVREASGHYTGSSRLKLSDFGIKPIKAAGGTVRVKDEIRIEFDIQLAR